MPLVVASSCLVNTGLSAETTATPIAIDVTPTAVQLTGPRSRQQFVVTALFAGGEVQDVTDQVTFSCSDPAILKVEGSRIRPLADGHTRLIATLSTGQTDEVDVLVRQSHTSNPVSFRTEVLAALTKAGCNMGACHGSPSGKGGFRLSLRGYDPPLDLETLRTEFQGRRTNTIHPDASLILKKPLMEISHAGGQRLHRGDAPHRVLRQWIAEGLRIDTSSLPELTKIEVLPGDRVFHDRGARQQLLAMGTFSDGTLRDVTALTVFSSSDDTIATVSADGLVTKSGRGEVAILARYLEKMDTVNLTFLEQIPGFAWSHPEEHNFIDRLVNDKLRRLQILPSALCSDVDFLRRAFLDLCGRLPSLTETNAFLDDPADDKRSRLVDRLLDSPDHASFWTLRWADVLRSNSGTLTPAGVAKFHHWIYEGILRDQPMDQFARTAHRDGERVRESGCQLLACQPRPTGRG